MKRSHDHTHLTRLAALGLVFTLVLTILPTGGVQAGPWIDENKSAICPDNDLLILDLDWERDVVGTTPDLWRNLAYDSQDNVTMTIHDAGDVHGNVLRIRTEGTITGEPRFGAYIGRLLKNNYSLSFDFFVNEYSDTKPGYIGINFGNSVESLLIKCSVSGPYGGSKIFGNAGFAYTIQTWHHVDLLVDQYNQQYQIFVDGEYLRTDTFDTSPYVSYFVFNVFRSQSDGVRDVWFDNIKVYQEGHEVQAIGDPVNERTKIAIVFDDAWDSVYDVAYPIMQAYGLVGTVSLPSSYANGADRLTWEELNELYHNGWGIVSHGVNHNTSMTTMDETQMRYEFAESRRVIEENIPGLVCNGFVYPGNNHNEETDRIGWEYYDYLSSEWGRVSMGGEAGVSIDDMLRRVNTAKLVIPAVYGYNSFVEIYTHAVRDGAPYGSITPANFEYFMDIYERNECNLVTLSDAYQSTRSISQARISGDPSEFTVSFDHRSSGRYDNVITTLRLNGSYAPDRYAVVSNGALFSTIEHTGGPLIVQVPQGTYEIMTMSEFREEQIDRAMSPLYAAIPVVVMLAVLGGLITMVGRIKF